MENKKEKMLFAPNPTLLSQLRRELGHHYFVTRERNEVEIYRLDVLYFLLQYSRAKSHYRRCA